MIKVKNILKLLVVVVLMVPLGEGVRLNAAKTNRQTTTKINFKEKVCKVSGVCCFQCSKKLKQVLEAIPGMKKVEIDFKAGEAKLQYDPKKVTELSIAEAIEKTGFACDLTEK